MADIVKCRCCAPHGCHHDSDNSHLKVVPQGDTHRETVDRAGEFQTQTEADWAMS